MPDCAEFILGHAEGVTRGLHPGYDNQNGGDLMDRLKGKIAIVVGAGSIGPGWGNGKATAVTFAREGAQVFCVDRNGTAAAETANIIASEGGKASAFTADVSRAGEVEAMVAACLKAHRRIDVLDNNVGIAEMGSVVEVAEADWDRVFAVNLKSAFLAMKHVIPVMARQGGGSIINISSIASIRHLGISYVTYATTKAAMNQMTRTTAVEYAPKNIRVNAILPGLMKTPMVEHSAGLAASYAKGDVKGDAKGDVKGGDVEAMWRARDAQVPMGHMGDAWDVANAALFLASDESKYVTGLELVVDGGITLKVS
jgi:NAD(P)-dependent dehydrogenase (short-subunit alcohol dehydrogenase family)